MKLNLDIESIKLSEDTLNWIKVNDNGTIKVVVDNTVRFKNLILVTNFGNLNIELEKDDDGNIKIKKHLSRATIDDDKIVTEVGNTKVIADERAINLSCEGIK